LIASAEKSIDFTSFIIKRDLFGRALIGLLLNRAKRGVKIRLMIDGRGSGKLVRSLTGYDELQEGQRVSFTEGRGEKGPRAENVKPI